MSNFRSAFSTSRADRQLLNRRNANAVVKRVSISPIVSSNIGMPTCVIFWYAFVLPLASYPRK